MRINGNSGYPFCKLNLWCGAIDRRKFKQQYLERCEGMRTEICHLLRGVCCDNCFEGQARTRENLERTVPHAWCFLSVLDDFTKKDKPVLGSSLVPAGK